MQKTLYLYLNSGSQSGLCDNMAHQWPVLKLEVAKSPINSRVDVSQYDKIRGG